MPVSSLQETSWIDREPQIIDTGFTDSCRAVLESVWKRFSNLGSPGRSTYPTYPREQIDTISSGSGSSVDFETPQAAFTNVLVLGATGK